MSDISRIGSPYRAAPVGIAPQGHRPTHVNGSATPRGEDRVDFSDHAVWLSKLHDVSGVRQDVVDRVRAQIQDGTYETNQRIDGAIDKLIDDLT